MTTQLREQANYWHMPEYDMEMLNATFTRHQFPLHFHEEYVVAVMEHGVHRFFWNGAVTEMRQGQVLMLNPGEVHGCHDIDNPWQYRCFYPSVTMMRQLAREMTDQDWSMLELVKPVVMNPHLATTLSTLHRAMEHSRTRLLKDTLLREAMGLLLQQYAVDGSNSLALNQDNQAVARAQDYLQTYYAQDVSLDDLASAVHLSPYHLSRIFKTHTGLPPHKYLIQVRIQRAKILLAQGQSIADVAVDVGFADQSHLTKWFKRVVGVPPGQFVGL